MSPPTGRQIPVRKKPAEDMSHSRPVTAPIPAGNIRFPAPKNIANIANPNINTSLFFFIINSSAL